MITQEQWKYIEDQYGMLMAKICHKISGDRALCSYEDNLQDLKLSSLDAISGYARQNGGANGTFDEFHKTKGFDRYFKTCLWNSKNNKGANITKKAGITKHNVSMHDNPEVMTKEGPDSLRAENNAMLDDLMGVFKGRESQVLKLIINDHTLIKKNGKINISKIADAMELPRHEAEKIVKQMPFLS
tara:strand:- start:1048 stop:1605 length:558 start_codon:yes stop_codon:yes gene_type:complete